MRRFVIAVDVGTASARAGLFDGDGYMKARSVYPLDLSRDTAQRGEYSSENIWQAVATTVRAVRAEADIEASEIAAIAFGATCSLVFQPAGEKPAALSRQGFDTIAWFDHRASAEAFECTATGHDVLSRLGGVMSPEMQIPKLMWARRNRPDLLESGGNVFDLADFLTFLATGSTQRSISTLASKWTYLPETETGWSHDFLKAVGLEDLPARDGLDRRPLAIGAAIGPLTANAARDLGLDEAVLVAPGMVDAYAGALGVLPPPQTGSPSPLALIGGTSSCLVGQSAVPHHGKSLWGPFFSALYRGSYLVEAGQSATGGLLNHLLEASSAGGTATEALHDRVIARIKTLRAMEGDSFASGITMVPDFHGNRSPFADPAMTGMIAGLTLDKSFDGLCRLYFRALVAIALGLKQVIGAMAEAGFAADTLLLAGGHARNPLLREIYPDVTGKTLVLAREKDAVLLGSAINAASAAGLHAGLAAAAVAMQASELTVVPDPRRTRLYERDMQRLLILQDCQAQLRAV
ncbi:FGGY-family carbohydrate kinase [Martelella sp. HB161492]|uniref:FGGY-family carbohydrate kinase n=1 Tax=Martelella sp. HB161492 TaxID=2720726 RepID=UPI0015925F33|nr:FGGY-family carbohydrate kinase [Martelella sp. HB161492]